MSDTHNTPSATTLLVGLLTIAFVILRLCGVIDWSWWLVLSPTIIYVCIWAFALIVVVLIAVTRMGNDDERD